MSQQDSRELIIEKQREALKSLLLDFINLSTNDLIKNDKIINDCNQLINEALNRKGISNDKAINILDELLSKVDSNQINQKEFSSKINAELGVTVPQALNGIQNTAGLNSYDVKLAQQNFIGAASLAEKGAVPGSQTKNIFAGVLKTRTKIVSGFEDALEAPNKVLEQLDTKKDAPIAENVKKQKMMDHPSLGPLKAVIATIDSLATVGEMSPSSVLKDKVKTIKDTFDLDNINNKAQDKIKNQTEKLNNLVSSLTSKNNLAQKNKQAGELRAKGTKDKKANSRFGELSESLKEDYNAFNSQSLEQSTEQLCINLMIILLDLADLFAGLGVRSVSKVKEKVEPMRDALSEQSKSLIGDLKENIKNLQAVKTSPENKDKKDEVVNELVASVEKLEEQRDVLFEKIENSNEQSVIEENQENNALSAPESEESKDPSLKGNLKDKVEKNSDKTQQTQNENFKKNSGSSHEKNENNETGNKTENNNSSGGDELKKSIEDFCNNIVQIFSSFMSSLREHKKNTDKISENKEMQSKANDALDPAFSNKNTLEPENSNKHEEEQKEQDRQADKKNQEKAEASKQAAEQIEQDSKNKENIETERQHAEDSENEQVKNQELQEQQAAFENEQVKENNAEQENQAALENDNKIKAAEQTALESDNQQTQHQDNIKNNNEENKVAQEQAVVGDRENIEVNNENKADEINLENQNEIEHQAAVKENDAVEEASFDVNNETTQSPNISQTYSGSSSSSNKQEKPEEESEKLDKKIEESNQSNKINANMDENSSLEQENPGNDKQPTIKGSLNKLMGKVEEMTNAAQGALNDIAERMSNEGGGGRDELKEAIEELFQNLTDALAEALPTSADKQKQAGEKEKSEINDEIAQSPRVPQTYSRSSSSSNKQEEPEEESEKLDKKVEESNQSNKINANMDDDFSLDQEKPDNDKQPAIKGSLNKLMGKVGGMANVAREALDGFADGMSSGGGGDGDALQKATEDLFQNLTLILSDVLPTSADKQTSEKDKSDKDSGPLSTLLAAKDNLKELASSISEKINSPSKSSSEGSSDDDALDMPMPTSSNETSLKGMGDIDGSEKLTAAFEEPLKKMQNSLNELRSAIGKGNTENEDSEKADVNPQQSNDSDPMRQLVEMVYKLQDTINEAKQKQKEEEEIKQQQEAELKEQKDQQEIKEAEDSASNRENREELEEEQSEAQELEQIDSFAEVEEGDKLENISEDLEISDDTDVGMDESDIDVDASDIDMGASDMDMGASDMDMSAPDGDEGASDDEKITDETLYKADEKENKELEKAMEDLGEEAAETINQVIDEAEKILKETMMLVMAAVLAVTTAGIGDVALGAGEVATTATEGASTASTATEGASTASTATEGASSGVGESASSTPSPAEDIPSGGEEETEDLDLDNDSSDDKKSSKGGDDDSSSDDALQEAIEEAAKALLEVIEKIMKMIEKMIKMMIMLAMIAIITVVTAGIGAAAAPAAAPAAGAEAGAAGAGAEAGAGAGTAGTEAGVTTEAGATTEPSADVGDVGPEGQEAQKSEGPEEEKNKDKDQQKKKKKEKRSGDSKKDKKSKDELEQALKEVIEAFIEVTQSFAAEVGGPASKPFLPSGGPGSNSMPDPGKVLELAPDITNTLTPKLKMGG